MIPEKAWTCTTQWAVDFHGEVITRDDEDDARAWVAEMGGTPMFRLVYTADTPWRPADEIPSRTPAGNLPSNYHEITSTCPPGEHSYGWEGRHGRMYCECGVQICGHVSVNGGDTYVCVRPIHESNVGHLVALKAAGV